MEAGSRLILERPESFDDLKNGMSICVSGTCLTVIAFTKDSMTFDVVPETIAKTKLGKFKAGDRVNLERALPATGRFDGHIVQGHVEGVACVVSVAVDGRLTIELSLALQPYIVEKGSIAIDGVSLTVASVKGNTCEVALIPQTLSQTTLGMLREGEHVNIETDIIGRTLAHFLPSRP